MKSALYSSKNILKTPKIYPAEQGDGTDLELQGNSQDQTDSDQPGVLSDKHCLR